MSYFELRTNGSCQLFNKDQYYVAWELLKNALVDDWNASLKYIQADVTQEDIRCFIKVEDEVLLSGIYREINILPKNEFKSHAAYTTNCRTKNAVQVNDDVYVMYLPQQGRLTWIYSSKLFALERFMKHEFPEFIEKNGWFKNASK